MMASGPRTIAMRQVCRVGMRLMSPNQHLTRIDQNAYLQGMHVVQRRSSRQQYGPIN